MLSELQIRDYAIVDRLYVKFKSGMTVFSGETGAGKSIAIDALGIALGDRAESSVVRHDAKRAEITASFDITNNAAANHWLEDHELDEDGECILRRTVNKDGGSKAYVNGRPVPLQRVRELSELLIDIHSQHQHQSLLRQNEQRNLLDSYGQCTELARELAQAYRSWKKTKQQYDDILATEQDRQSRVDFLKFQIDEFEKLDPKQGEWRELEDEHQTLANKEKIEMAISRGLQMLDDDSGGALIQLNQAINTLNSVATFNQHIQNSVELLNNAQVQVEEALHDLNVLTEDTNLDQGRFQWLEQRISDYMDLARKHRCKAEELVDLREQLQDELASLTNADENLTTLEKQIDELHNQYQRLASQLTQIRQKAANKLSSAVTKHLDNLGMSGAKFSIELVPLGNDLPSTNGNESINFCVSTNKGQASQPINKVASGGELSRISLAIQVVTAKVAKIPCLVFDEVDVGIGGGTAEVVGQLLRKLGVDRQVICITHQPQVAAQGHQHFRVEKSSDKTTTTTQFTLLSEQQRCEEIARMLGGIKVTDTTMKHASEMLELAE
jgi:DNA repair protein RecN (Recombination protein N)